jgi:hypothetical protein
MGKPIRKLQFASCRSPHALPLLFSIMQLLAPLHLLLIRRSENAGTVGSGCKDVCANTGPNAVDMSGKQVKSGINPSVITLNPAIRDRVKSGHREWPKT